MAAGEAAQITASDAWVNLWPLFALAAGLICGAISKYMRRK